MRIYYQQFEEQQTQSLIDQRIKEHLSGQGAFQIGAAYAAWRPGVRPPLLPAPLPIPGSLPSNAQMPPGIRLPVFPRPPGFPGNLMLSSYNICLCEFILRLSTGLLKINRLHVFLIEFLL